MRRVAVLGLSVSLAAVGCAHASLSDPVVARTGGADTNDGYLAALAAVRADDYQVVEGTQQSGYLRVTSKLGGDRFAPGSIGISIWPGSVRLDASLRKGQAASESDVARLHQEMQMLAWAIAARARALAGEAIGPATTRPYANTFDRSWRSGADPYAGGLR